MTGNIIDFPPRDLSARSCFNCVFYALSYCHLFGEQIDSELFAAKDCDGYEEDPR